MGAEEQSGRTWSSLYLNSRDTVSMNEPNKRIVAAYLQYRNIIMAQVYM